MVIDAKDADAGLIAHLSPFFPFCGLRPCPSRIQSGEPPEWAICRLDLEGDMARDGQIDLRSARSAAAYCESGANSLRPLAHPRESPVSIAPRPQRLRVYAAT